jgi:hypothetical protein
MGTLLGTLQKGRVKPRLYRWTDLGPALKCAVNCAHPQPPVQVTCGLWRRGHRLRARSALWHARHSCADTPTLSSTRLNSSLNA